MRCVIVTGMSGAGKSTALKMLEDMGYFCVDNLPVPLIPKFAELLAVPGTEMNKAALGVDIRSGQNFYELKKIGVVMKKAQYFITCKELPLQMQTVNELSPQRVRSLLLPKPKKKVDERQLLLDFGE